MCTFYLHEPQDIVQVTTYLVPKKHLSLNKNIERCPYLDFDSRSICFKLVNFVRQFHLSDVGIGSGSWTDRVETDF